MVKDRIEHSPSMLLRAESLAFLGHDHGLLSCHPWRFLLGAEQSVWVRDSNGDCLTRRIHAEALGTDQFNRRVIEMPDIFWGRAVSMKFFAKADRSRNQLMPLKSIRKVQSLPKPSDKMVVSCLAGCIYIIRGRFQDIAVWVDYGTFLQLRHP